MPANKETYKTGRDPAETGINGHTGTSETLVK
jgi:hypothetical protein